MNTSYWRLALYKSIGVEDKNFLGSGDGHGHGHGAANGDAADGDFVLVVDRVDGDRARRVTANWHAHPNATGVAVGADGASAVPTA